MIVQRLRVIGVPKSIEQVSQPLHVGTIKVRCHRGKLIAVNLSTKVDEHGCDGINATRDLNIAKQVERC